MIRDRQAEGTVTKVRTCWWLKVNTKPVRLNGMDGARVPHIVKVCWQAEGADCARSFWVNWNYRCPPVGARVTVRYPAGRPNKGKLEL